MESEGLHPDDIKAGDHLKLRANMVISCANGITVVLHKGRKLYVVETAPGLAMVAFTRALRDPQGTTNPYLTFSKDGFEYCLWVSVYKLAKHSKKTEE